MLALSYWRNYRMKKYLGAEKSEGLSLKSLWSEEIALKHSD